MSRNFGTPNLLSSYSVHMEFTVVKGGFLGHVGFASLPGVDRQVEEGLVACEGIGPEHSFDVDDVAVLCQFIK